MRLSMSVASRLSPKPSRRQTRRTWVSTMIPLGTCVTSDMVGREAGLVIGYNGHWEHFYPPLRYPYVVLWEDGYFDYYNPSSFQVAR